MQLLIITIIAVIVIYAVFVIVFPKAVPDDGAERTQKALKKVYEETYLNEKEDDVAIASNFDDEPEIVRRFFSLPFIRNLYFWGLKAGLKDKSLAIMNGYIGVTLLLGLASQYAKLSIGGLVFAPVLAYFMLRFYLKRKVRKRNEAFINDFPDVLDMFVRSLKSGFPVTTAFRSIAENMEPPISTEFQRVVQEQSMGQSVNAALTRLSERVDEPDIHFFVVVMKVQQETGGNLAEVISNLSNVIRKRKQLRLKIKALTSEGRTTSMILGALPLIVFGALAATSADYVRVLWTDLVGMICLGVCVFLIASCMLLVNKMIAIDI